MHSMNHGVQLLIEPVLSTRAQIDTFLLKTSKDMAIKHLFFTLRANLEALSPVVKHIRV
jgi:hypothetical protein